MEIDGLCVICAGLGIVEEDDNGNRIGYSKSEYCLDNLKDLLRFLRRDDPQTRDVFKQVCKWNIVAKDLIPIIEYCQDDRNAVLNAVKILVFLTMPVEPTSNDIAQQIEYLWGLKSLITCCNVVAVAVSLLESPLENLDCETFSEDDWKLVQLVMTLFRNVLAIQEISLQQKADGSACQLILLRDKFLEVLFRENVMDIILVITQHIDGSCSHLRQDKLLFLEIFYFIFLGQEPELIAKVSQNSDEDNVETVSSANSLKSLMEEDRRKLSRSYNMNRHSQFSGTFTRHTLDGSKLVLKGKPSPTSCNSLKQPKVCRGPIKKIAWDHGRLTSKNSKLLRLLHDFINQFLSGGYNALMQLVHEDIEKEHHSIQNNDVVVFFQVAQFAVSFQYHKFSTSKLIEADTTEAQTEHADSTFFQGNMCGPIAATMNEAMFQLVVTKWRYAFEGLKETSDFKFLSAAGSLMKNMICMLDLVLKLLPEDSKEPQTARILLYKLFYDQTDQGITQFLLNLLKSFNTHKQPKSDLADLVEMIYKVVQLMEDLQARGTLRVSKKSRRGRKAKSANNRDVRQSEDQVAGNKTAITHNEKSIDADVGENNDLKASSDGKEEISITAPELLNLNTGSFEGSVSQRENNKLNDDYSTADSSGNEQQNRTVEVDLKVSSLVSTFANNNIIQKICWLLKFYKSNSTNTNHYIICILRRITEDLELSPMLYQLSLLPTFYDILSQQKSSPCKEHANIVDFLTSLVRKMLRKIKNQPLLFVELLFWKTRKECHYIDAEYLVHELGCWKKKNKEENFTGDDENGSLMGKHWTPRSIADALGEDEADVVITNEFEIHTEAKSDEVERGLESTTLVDEIYGKEHNENELAMDDKSKSLPKRKRLVLDAALETEIKDLYEKFKEDRNCSRLIAENLGTDVEVSPAQVSNKLRRMGLKVSQRKRRQYADEAFSGTSKNLKGESNGVERNNLLDSDVLGESSLSQPSHTRKRVVAFDKVYEEKIRALYEQFKDHKRCSSMIANALDAGNKFTSAQVSRKLKQLGLYVSHQKRSSDGDHNDSVMDKGFESDDETLLSLINRKKRKHLATEKLSSISTQSILIAEESEGVDAEMSTQWEDSNQASRLEPMGVGKVRSDDVQLNDFTEVEGKDAEAGVSMDDELADSEGEMDSNVHRASATTGRKFRIVDLEDED
ncbi:protein timeless homolog isoform X2 [Cucurbita moschata]|uniref:Protein timeless homolog isoform X2 n=1 Tax=Cucurbita moschata TaxID=3662 RepID=A0A6J1H072_CUCMO|nr:protein timeless homolog isoform X2 [Cucurbita moschata]